jgi:hypothetical protein
VWLWVGFQLWVFEEQPAFTLDPREDENDWRPCMRGLGHGGQDLVDSGGCCQEGTPATMPRALCSPDWPLTLSAPLRDLILTPRPRLSEDPQVP